MAADHLEPSTNPPTQHGRAASVSGDVRVEVRRRALAAGALTPLYVKTLLQAVVSQFEIPTVVFVNQCQPLCILVIRIGGGDDA